MPILDVDIVVADDEVLDAALPSQLADAAGEVFGAVAGSAWVRVRPVPRAQYAENGGGPPEGVHPVLVRVLVAEVPTGSELRNQVHRLTAAIAKVCERPPENVHLVYEPPARGRVAFGGKLAGGAGG
jgi:phenylpyruvate tautomerase PptA (4-oxalocrotonate tautomerase family)